jgi:hypothetical protein
MVQERVFVFDWPKVKPEVMEAFNLGNLDLRDGVAYWDKGKGSVIAQHMPLKDVMVDSSKGIQSVLGQLQAAQNIQLAATALSTGLILGAIVVQTMYLAKKIDKLQQQIDLVSQDVHSQNVLYFMGQLSEYFGLLESARVLLLDKELVEESRGIAEQYMAQLAAKRNELLSLIDNLVSYVDSASERHASLMLDFVNMMFDLLPKSIHLEVQLYERYGKSKLADHIAETAKQRYENVLANYKMWCNNKARGVLNGSGTEHAKLFHEKESQLKQLFNSEINQILLKPQVVKKIEHVHV